MQFLGISDYWKSLSEVRRELEMELLAMEWMTLMIYSCSHGLGLLLAPRVLFMKVVSTSWSCFVARIIQTIHHLLDFRQGLTWLASTKNLEWLNQICFPCLLVGKESLQWKIFCCNWRKKWCPHKTGSYLSLLKAMKMEGLTKRGWCWDVVSCNSGENLSKIM